MYDRSDDEVFELSTVLVGLSAEDVSENSYNNVIGVVLGILDNSVSQKEFNSDILEAVWGKQEGNSVPLDNISDLNSGLIGLAGVKHFLSFSHKSKGVNE